LRAKEKKKSYNIALKVLAWNLKSSRYHPEVSELVEAAH
jgi:hypothetical protein